MIRLWQLWLVAALALLQVGCTVTVKDIKGLTACREDSAQVEALAYSLRKRLPADGRGYSDILLSYTAAQSAVNSQYDAVITRIENWPYVIELSESDYKDSSAAKTSGAFIALAKDRLGNSAFDPISTALFIAAGRQIAVEILALNNAHLKEAQDRARKSIAKHRIPNFELLTDEFMMARYQSFGN